MAINIYRKALITGKALITEATYDEIDYNYSQCLSVYLRKKSYKGNCVRLRRSVDNAEMDFGFVDGYVDEASIIAWKGISSLWIVKWYDQSGKGWDAIQLITIKQPEFLKFAGVLNEKWSTGYNGFTRYLRSGFKPSNDVSMFVSIKPSNTNSMLRWQIDGSGTTPYLVYTIANGKFVELNNSGVNGIESGLTLSQNQIGSAIVKIGEVNGAKTYINGVVNDSQTWNSAYATQSDLTIGAFHEVQSSYFLGFMSDVLIFDEALTDFQAKRLNDELISNYNIS